MASNCVFLYCVTAFLVATLAAKLPSEFPRCKQEDPEFSNCMKNAIEKSLKLLDNGIPSLNVPPLQPMRVPSISIGEGTGPVNVVQNYSNFELYNMRDSVIKKIDITSNSKIFKMDVDLFTEEIRYESDYSLNGRILLVPVVGTGKCTVKLEKLQTKLLLEADIIDRKGKNYVKVKNITLKLTPEKVSFDFRNLFNGDEKLGAEINRLLNNNWKDVFEDVRKQYEEALSTIFIDFASRILYKIPYNDLF